MEKIHKDFMDRFESLRVRAQQDKEKSTELIQHFKTLIQDMFDEICKLSGENYALTLEVKSLNESEANLRKDNEKLKVLYQELVYQELHRRENESKPICPGCGKPWSDSSKEKVK